MKKILLVILVTVLPISASQANPGWFFGVGGGLISSEDNADTIEPVNLFLRGGLGINEYLDVGVEVSSALSDDDIDSIDFEVETTLVFIKFNLGLGEGKTVYAMLGSASVEITAEQGSNSITADDSDTAFGIGVAFDYSGSSVFFIDYISYYDDDQFDGVSGDLTVDGLNFGFVSYF